MIGFTVDYVRTWLKYKLKRRPKVAIAGVVCGMCSTRSGESCEHITFLSADEFYALLGELDADDKA